MPCFFLFMNHSSYNLNALTWYGANAPGRSFLLFFCWFSLHFFSFFGLRPQIRLMDAFQSGPEWSLKLTCVFSSSSFFSGGFFMVSNLSTHVRSYVECINITRLTVVQNLGSATGIGKPVLAWKVLGPSLCPYNGVAITLTHWTYMHVGQPNNLNNA